MHRDGRWARFGRLMGLAGPTSTPLATDLLWYTALWVLFSDTSVPGFDWSVCSDMCASFVYFTQDAIFYDFVCIFFVFSSYSGLVLLKT